MNILLTGGTGLIGRHLVPKLSDSHEICVLTRSPKRAKAILGKRVKLVNSLSELDNLDHFDAVINLAGEPIADRRWSTAQKQKIQDSRWGITRQLAALMTKSRQPPSVVISGSAVGYYGKQGDNFVDEFEGEIAPDFAQQLCSTWEGIAADMATEVTRVCLLRTGIVLAPDGGALGKMLLPFKLGLGGPMGSGAQYMPWIHIDDMVTGIIFLLNQTECSGPYNLVAPEPVTNKVFSQSLAKALHRPCLLATPAFALKALLGEMADLLLYGQRVIPKRLLDAGFHFKHRDVLTALDDITQ